MHGGGALVRIGSRMGGAQAVEPPAGSIAVTGGLGKRVFRRAPAPLTLGTVTVHADVPIHPGGRRRGRQLDRGPGGRACAAGVGGARQRNPGRCVVRVVIDTVVTGGNVAVTGRVYRHATASNPDSPPAVGAAVDSSVTNVLLAP